MSTYKGTDDCTDILLDFLAGAPGVAGNPSGESRGNYNAVIGNADATDDLSAKTLTEIYALMDELLAAGRPSTAVGRYQIIRRTMEALQAKLAFDDDTLFTPQVQDTMAWHLMIGRGYPAWWRGHMTDAEFMHGLSCEWASLPDPERGGASHYDGVGQNHAGTTLANFEAALQAARAAQASASASKPASAKS